jgi:hypothetical protein
MVTGTFLVGALVSHLVSLLALVWLCIIISGISHRLLRLMANPPEVPYVIPEPPMKAVTLPKLKPHVSVAKPSLPSRRRTLVSGR